MKPKVLLTLILISCGLGLSIITFFTSSGTPKDFGEFALGKGTASYFAKVRNDPIHLGGIEQLEVQRLMDGWKKRGEKDVILVLGNSQTHGINQYVEGQKSYNHLLFDAFYQEYDVLALSVPNANLQEFYLAFEYLSQRLPVKRVLIPVFMDDLRDDGIKQYFFSGLEDFKINGNSVIAQQIDEEIATYKKEAVEKVEDKDFIALEQTIQEKSEKSLNNFFNKHFSIWRSRPTLRGDIFLNLYFLRNTVLGISAQTKRNMIPEKYKKNITALKALVQSATLQKIKPLLYIPPLRTDVEPPYVLTEYAAFKQELKDFVEQNESKGVTFYNFEKIVPGELWGVKEATNLFGGTELDFMHFQYKGHQLLFEELNTAIKADENDF